MLTAKLEGEILYVESSDNISGVETVYVDSTCISGKVSVALKDYAANNKQVLIYAVDYSSNRS